MALKSKLFYGVPVTIFLIFINVSNLKNAAFWHIIGSVCLSIIFGLIATYLFSTILAAMLNKLKKNSPPTE